MGTKSDISTLFNLLDQELSVDTFSDRKKLQKLVYLSEVFRIDLDFTFTWYIHGPYSPQLTRVMFDKEQGSSMKVKEIPNINKKIKNLKNFLGDDINSSRNLELIASIHYIASIVEDPIKSKSKILDTIYNEKPQFQKEEVDQCYNRIITLFNN